MANAGDATAPLSREQVLDELDRLARIEHALCVRYLLIYCALGQDVELAPGAGPVLERVAAAAGAARNIAENDMRHLHRINTALTLAGRPSQVGRASSIRQDSASDIALGSQSPVGLEGFLDREAAIAAAVDARYARLVPSVSPEAPVLEGDLLDQVSFILSTCSDHATPLAEIGRPLTGTEPAIYIRAIRREPADDVERRLLQLSDQQYNLIVATVGASFAYDDQLGGQLLPMAVTAMDALNTINRGLVGRGLLPNFALASST